MKTESSYIYEEYDKTQGLGWVHARPVMLRPIRYEPFLSNRNQKPRPRILPQLTPKTKPENIPGPVIDKNPVRPPKLIVNTAKKGLRPTLRKTLKPTASKTTQKVNKDKPNASSKILTGTFNIGGVQVKKTHAALATGGIAGGLFLWKILFK